MPETGLGLSRVAGGSRRAEKVLSSCLFPNSRKIREGQGEEQPSDKGATYVTQGNREQRVRTQAAPVRSRRWGKMEKGAGKRQSHFLLLSGEPSPLGRPSSKPNLAASLDG